MKKIRSPNPEDWSPTWKSSKQPRKQRKYVYNAPWHYRRKMMVAHLCDEIRQIVKRRSFPVRVGDYVRIERGKWKGQCGYIIYCDYRNYRVYVDCAYIVKKNGEKVYYPIHPSKLTILKLNLTDKKRLEALIRGKNLTEEEIEKLKQISIINPEEIKQILELAKQFR